LDEGRTLSEILAERPRWNIFHDGSPQGESPGEISDRADRLIAKLRTLDGNIALFSHSHMGRVLVARWLGLPVAEGEHFLLGTASLSILGYEQTHTEVPAILVWNAFSQDFLPHE